MAESPEGERARPVAASSGQDCRHRQQADMPQERPWAAVRWLDHAHIHRLAAWRCATRGSSGVRQLSCVHASLSCTCMQLARLAMPPLGISLWAEPGRAMPPIGCLQAASAAQAQAQARARGGRPPGQRLHARRALRVDGGPVRAALLVPHHHVPQRAHLRTCQARPEQFSSGQGKELCVVAARAVAQGRGAFDTKRAGGCCAMKRNMGSAVTGAGKPP